MSKNSNYQAQKSGILLNNLEAENLSGFIYAYTHIEIGYGRFKF
jgi:hypothetical protein